MVVLPILDMLVLPVELVVIITAPQLAVEMEAGVEIVVQEETVGMLAVVVVRVVTAVMAVMVGTQLLPMQVEVAVVPVAVAAVEQEALI